jgi:basic amino acid/polyamine antiporter, APA family
VLNWIQRHQSDTSTQAWLQPNAAINVPAFVVSVASTALLLSGVQESKRIVNWITAFKMVIVLCMIVGGFLLYRFDLRQQQPFAPFGVAGVLRGATTSFFGYLGYDEICCVAGEARHPVRDLPRAVLGTLATVTVCYILAAVALTGMLPYTEISPTAGFPDAFRTRGWEVAAQVTAAGEVLTLPVVVLISLMAQPRLTLSMAVDGLLPKIFAKVDAGGNLTGGTMVAGTAMTIIATFVPFTYLDDLISAGILVAFSMTNACLLLLRCESPIHRDGYLEVLLGIYNVLCFLTALLWTHDWSLLPFQNFFAALSTLSMLLCVLEISRTCPRTMHFGGSILREGEYSSERHITHESDHDDIVSPESDYFATPFIPYLPCLGMAVNWYLIAQLDFTGILLLILYLGIVSVIYGLGCAPNSVGHNRNWNQQGSYQAVNTGSAATGVRIIQHMEADNDDDSRDGGLYYDEPVKDEIIPSNGSMSAQAAAQRTRTNSL